MRREQREVAKKKKEEEDREHEVGEQMQRSTACRASPPCPMLAVASILPRAVATSEPFRRQSLSPLCVRPCGASCLDQALRFCGAKA